MHSSRIILLICAITGICSSFLPWSCVSLSGYNETITGTKGAGLISCGLSAIAVITVLAGNRRLVASPMKKWTLVTLGSLVAWTGFFEFKNVTIKFAGDHPGFNGISIGSSAAAGLYLSIAASLCLVIFSLIFGDSRRHSVPAD